MKNCWIACAALLGFALSGSVALGDQILLKNGREFSGKFVRGDANVVEFRVLGRVETFKTVDVAQIVFKEPELVNPPSGRTLSTAPSAGDVQRENPPVQPAPDQNQGVQANGAQAPLDRNKSVEATGIQASTESSSGPTVTLPAGTDLTIRMTEGVDTDRNKVGDTFQATLEQPLSIGSQVIVPKGSEVRGAVAYAKESGRVSGKSELILELTELKANGRTYPLRTEDYSEVGSSRGKRTAAAAGGTAALGAIIGAIAGGGKGAAIGAATGAAAGTGVAVLTNGQTIKVPAETVLTFKLQKPLTIDVQ